MNPKLVLRLVVTLGVIWGIGGCSNICKKEPLDRAVGISESEDVAIFFPQESSLLEALGAREVRRYVYLRTGQLVPVVHVGESIPPGINGIVVASKNRSLAKSLEVAPETRSSLTTLEPEHFLLKTIERNGQRIVLMAAGDALGTLYGAYRFAEHLGVRFYLLGDTIPDKGIALELPILDERAKSLFDVREILPFHDFPEGPDWRNLGEYKAILSQLPKLRMNFYVDVQTHEIFEGKNIS